jgi:hypothetical protein
LNTAGPESLRRVAFRERVCGAKLRRTAQGKELKADS